MLIQMLSLKLSVYDVLTHSYAEQEDKWLRSLVEQYGPKRWKKVSVTTLS